MINLFKTAAFFAFALTGSFVEATFGNNSFPTCTACQNIVTGIEEYELNKLIGDNFVINVDDLCNNLPDLLHDECKFIVTKYDGDFVQLFENFVSNKVCEELYLCNSDSLEHTYDFSKFVRKYSIILYEFILINCLGMLDLLNLLPSPPANIINAFFIICYN